MIEMKIKIIDENMRSKFNFLPDKEYEATPDTNIRRHGSVYFATNEDGRSVGFDVPGKINSLIQEVT